MIVTYGSIRPLHVQFINHNTNTTINCCYRDEYSKLQLYSSILLQNYIYNVSRIIGYLLDVILSSRRSIPFINSIKIKTVRLGYYIMTFKTIMIIKGATLKTIDGGITNLLFGDFHISFIMIINNDIFSKFM